MQLQQNISLKPYNTFGIDVQAEYLATLTSAEQLPELSGNNELPPQKHIIGGGSNILLTHPVAGFTILNRTKGIEKIRENEQHVWLKVSSGEVWHELVMYTIANNWSGIENLALIPGTVGAAPMQNIGAYGVEVKETVESVTAWHWEQKELLNFSNSECRFGYRDSIFKHELKGLVFITEVTLKLNKEHHYNTSYGAIQQELDKMGIEQLSAKAIADAVIAIRSSKLPDPKVIGNAGSFFKNPAISIEQFNTLKAEHENIPSYPVDEHTVKVPAGWLIEQSGLKGLRRGSTGVHEKQALVLVNYGNANGTDVYNLSEEILETVQNKFGILLEREVQIW